MSPKVVLDTNVLVSGLLGGTATDLIRRWRSGAFTLIVSEEIVAEYKEVLMRPKFSLPNWVVEELLDYVRSTAQWIEPSSAWRRKYLPGYSTWRQALWQLGDAYSNHGRICAQLH